GVTLDGLTLIACVANAAGDCDENKSTVSTLGAGSRAFAFQGPSEPFYLMAWRDDNSSQAVDPGDLFGGVLETDGTLKLLTAPLEGVEVTVRVLPTVQGSVPAEIVGNWLSRSGGGARLSYTFNANGSYVYAGRYEPSVSCIVGGFAITESGT